MVRSFRAEFLPVPDFGRFLLLCAPGPSSSYVKGDEKMMPWASQAIGSKLRDVGSAHDVPASRKQRMWASACDCRNGMSDRPARPLLYLAPDPRSIHHCDRTAR
jgi:hypothetical protein